MYDNHLVEEGTSVKSLPVCRVMHQSIPAVPIPPGQPRGICSRCQSRRWGIRNFIAARGLGICVPQGNPRAFDTRVFESGIEELFLKVCFLNFRYFFITCKHINIKGNNLNYILFITYIERSETINVNTTTAVFRILHSKLA